MEVYKLLLIVWLASFIAQLLISSAPLSGKELETITDIKSDPLSLSGTLKTLFGGIWIDLTKEEPPISYIGYIMLAIQNIALGYLVFRLALGLASRVVG